MNAQKAVLRSANVIPALDITDEEKAENEAKFKAWYENFMMVHRGNGNGAKNSK
jgi:hypothetical protein